MKFSRKHPALWLNVLAIFLIAQNGEKLFKADTMRPDPGLTQDVAQMAKAGQYRVLMSSPTGILAEGPGGTQIEVSTSEFSDSTNTDCNKLSLVGEKVDGLDLTAAPPLTGAPTTSAIPPQPDNLAPAPSVGQTFSGAAPSSSASATLSSTSSRTIATSAGITRFTARQEVAVNIIDATIDRKRAIDSAARKDTETLVQSVANLPASQLSDALGRAKDKLGISAMALFQSKSGLDAGEARRFGNLFLTAKDKTDAAIELVSSAQFKDEVDSRTPFRSFLQGAPGEGSEIKKAMGELFSGLRDALSPTSPESLTDRIVIYNMLPEAQQAAVRGDLSLMEPVEISTGGGQKQKVDLLHNGYLLSGKTGVSCSSLASAVLGPHVRQGGLTTLDFRAIWEFQQTGIFPKEPRYDATREGLIRNISQAFTAHNLYAGDTPRAGDFLVYSVPWKAIGHVFIVRNYNRQTMKAQVMEASQSAGGIREREFSLTLYPADAPKRHIRPGLMVLRLQQDDKGACKTGKEVAQR